MGPGWHQMSHWAPRASGVLDSVQILELPLVFGEWETSPKMGCLCLFLFPLLPVSDVL